MKYPLFLFLGATAFLSAAPVARLAAEWYVPHSAHDSFSLVDTAAGTVRTGTIQANGTTTFTTAVTGITNVSDVAVAVYADGEFLTLTSPESNRIALLRLDGTGTPAVLSLTAPQGIGHSGLSEIQSATHPELLVSSLYNGGASSLHFEVLEDLGTTPATSLAARTQSHSSFAAYRIEPVSLYGGSTTIGFYTAPSGSNTRWGFISHNGGSVALASNGLLSGQVSVTTNIITKPDLSTNRHHVILGLRPGSSVSHQLMLPIAPLSNGSSVTGANKVLPGGSYNTAAVIGIPAGGTGNMDDGFLAIAADGSRATWFRVVPDPLNFEATGVSFSPESSDALTGILPLPGGKMLMLTGPTAGGPSTAYENYQWNSSDWELTGSGMLPALPESGAANLGTLLFYSADPIDDPAARLLGVQNEFAWTSRLPGAYQTVPTSVNRETFPANTLGLGDANPVAVNAPMGTGYVMTSQVDNALSVSAIGPTAAALYAPTLIVNPPSGSYDHAFQITADYDAVRQELYVRTAPSGAWEAWTGPINVGYNAGYQFYLKNADTGTPGPILTRDYTIPAPLIADLDSDGDGIPDYVESAYGLESGTPDFDRDGYPDLIELIAGSDPTNPGSTPSGTFPDIAARGGYEAVALATDAAAVPVANGEQFQAHRLDGSLLAGANVASLAVPLPDSTSRGARLRSDATIPANDLVILSSPLYFDTTTAGRSGREIIRLATATPPAPFEVSYTPTGTDLAADAAGWVAAAQTAAAAYHRVAAATTLEPVDNAVSVLVESLVYAALNEAYTRISATPPAYPLTDFTLFPQRSTDAAKVSLSKDDFQLLHATGFSFLQALAAASARSTELKEIAEKLLLHHSLYSEDNPGMMMPFDALRNLLRGTDNPPALPVGYSGAVTTTEILDARLAHNDELADAATHFRPTETWLIEIPASSPGLATYTRVSDSQSIVILDEFGDRFPLEQDLGLAPGTRFIVTGYTDTPTQDSYPSMEITAVGAASLPAGSNRDADANLLDDEWERFFFGETGQDPYREVQPGYSLLQYFLEGLDPRGDELPTGVLPSVQPIVLDFSAGVGGTRLLDIAFPTELLGKFDLVVEASETLQSGSFQVVPDITRYVLGTDQFRFTIPAAAASAPRCFYRVRVSLK